MTNEEILAEVVRIFKPSYKEEAVKSAQEFIQAHAKLSGLSPDAPLAPIAEHLLLAAEKLVEPSLSNNPMINSNFSNNNALF